MATCILFGGEKGGVGKSTIAANIAIMSALMGKDTLFIDTDKQRSTAKFFERRNDKGLKPQVPCVHIMGKYLHSEIDDLARKYEVIIIDAGGKDSIELRSAMVATTVSTLYTPLQPSEFDMDTLSIMDELTELSQTYNPNLKTYTILNMCHTNRNVTSAKDAKNLIQESFSENLNLCPVTLSHRVAYQYSISHCQAVVEYESEEIKRLPLYRARKYLLKATNEISELYYHIFNEKFKSLIPEKVLTSKTETTQ